MKGAAPRAGRLASQAPATSSRERGGEGRCSVHLAAEVRVLASARRHPPLRGPPAIRGVQVNTRLLATAGRGGAVRSSPKNPPCVACIFASDIPRLARGAGTWLAGRLPAPGRRGESRRWLKASSRNVAAANDRGVAVKAPAHVILDPLNAFYSSVTVNQARSRVPGGRACAGAAEPKRQ